MFPGTNFPGSQVYNLQQPALGNQGGFPQQYTGFPQTPPGGVNNAGSVDVNQLVMAVFQPIADLLNAVISGNAGLPDSGGGGGQFSNFQSLGTEGVGSSQFPGSQFADSQVYGGGPSGGSQFPGWQYQDLTGGNWQFPGWQGGGQFPGGGQPEMDDASQALQLLAQNGEALALFDADEDGNIDRSELLTFAKSQQNGISPQSQQAATWLAGEDGKKAFSALDGYGGAKEDHKFDLKALPIVASNPQDLSSESGIQNGQDALLALNDKKFIDSVSRKLEGQERPVIDFSKLEEVAKSEGDQYTDLQKEAAAFILEHDELKKILDHNDDGNFFADEIGRKLNNDPSISEIGAK